MKGKKVPRSSPPPASRGPRPPTQEQIAALAYALWQDRGCPQGNDLDFWLEAERMLKDGSSAPRPVAADDIPADLDNLDRDPAVEGDAIEAELDDIVQPRRERSPTAM